MSLSNHTLSEVMHQPLTTTTGETTVIAALALAQDAGVHHLPVVGPSSSASAVTAADGSSSRMLAGFVCTCDLYDKELNVRIADVMREPVTLDHAATAHEAAVLMRERGVGSVIVIENGEPCGIVTRGDVLRLADEAETLLGPSHCECCGLTRHLKTNAHGQTLCMFCDERAGEDGWFELGDKD